MTKARERGSHKSHRPAPITDASTAEQDYIKSTQRLSEKLGDLPTLVEGMQNAVAQSLEASGVEGVDVEDVDVEVQMPTKDGRMLGLNLATLRRMLKVMPGAAKRRLEQHQTSRSQGVRAAADKLLRTDNPLSDEEDKRLKANLRKLSDNF